MFPEELEALGFVTWPLPYQGGEFGELGKWHSGFAQPYADGEPFDVGLRVAAAAGAGSRDVADQ